MSSVMGAARLRMVELLGAISLATDLGTGQPPFHAVRTSMLAMAVGQELGLSDAALADVQHVALLRFLGCTSDSAQTAALNGGDDIAFLSAMAPVAMGAKPEMARRLVVAVLLVGLDGFPERRQHFRRGGDKAGVGHGGGASLSAHWRENH